VKAEVVPTSRRGEGWMSRRELRVRQFPDTSFLPPPLVTYRHGRQRRNASRLFPRLPKPRSHERSGTDPSDPDGDAECTKPLPLPLPPLPGVAGASHN